MHQEGIVHILLQTLSGAGAVLLVGTVRWTRIKGWIELLWGMESVQVAPSDHIRMDFLQVMGNGLNPAEVEVSKVDYDCDLFMRRS